MAELQGALWECRMALEACADPDERSPWVERVKAIRWCLEPWWPDLALTPWQSGDAFNPVPVG